MERNSLEEEIIIFYVFPRNCNNFFKQFCFILRMVCDLEEGNLQI